VPAVASALLAVKAGPPPARAASFGHDGGARETVLKEESTHVAQPAMCSAYVSRPTPPTVNEHCSAGISEINRAIVTSVNLGTLR
jgi:hypothetical protein